MINLIITASISVYTYNHDTSELRLVKFLFGTALISFSIGECFASSAISRTSSPFGLICQRAMGLVIVLAN